MACSQPHIYFVDDDQNVLNAIRRSFRPKSNLWHLDYYSDPREALEAAKSSPPDIVVSDLNMPHFNGIEMIIALRELSPSLEALLLTGRGDFHSAMDAINEAKVTRFYTKPCPAERLIEAIEDIIKECPRLSAPSDTIITSDFSEYSSLAHSTLELFSTCILAVETNGTVVFANRSATELLKEADGLAVDAKNICRLASTDHSKRFLEGLDFLSKSKTPDPLYLSCPRPSMKRDLKLMLVPLSENNADERMLISVVITDPDRETLNDPTHIIELFGLSRSEAMIAQMIAQGVNLENAAKNCDVTLSTARTYLKRAYSKMGVAGQAELVKLILSSPAIHVNKAS